MLAPGPLLPTWICENDDGENASTTVVAVVPTKSSSGTTVAQEAKLYLTLDTLDIMTDASDFFPFFRRTTVINMDKLLAAIYILAAATRKQ